MNYKKILVFSLFILSPTIKAQRANSSVRGGLAFLKNSEGKYLSLKKDGTWRNAWVKSENKNLYSIIGAGPDKTYGDNFRPIFDPLFFYSDIPKNQPTFMVTTGHEGMAHQGCTLEFLEENEKMLSKAIHINAADGGAREDYLSRCERIRFLLEKAWGFNSLTKISYGTGGFEFANSQAMATNVCMRSIKKPDGASSKIIFFTWKSPGNSWNTGIDSITNSTKAGDLAYFLPQTGGTGDFPSDRAMFSSTRAPHWTRNWGYGRLTGWIAKYSDILADSSGIVGGNVQTSDQMHRLPDWAYQTPSHIGRATIYNGRSFPLLEDFSKIQWMGAPVPGANVGQGLQHIRTNFAGNVGRVAPANYLPEFWAERQDGKVGDIWQDKTRMRNGRVLKQQNENLTEPFLSLAKLELAGENTEENKNSAVTEWQSLPSMPQGLDTALDFDLDEEGSIWLLDSNAKLHKSDDSGQSWTQYADLETLFTDGAPAGLFDVPVKISVSGRKSWNRVVFGLRSMFGQIAVAKGNYQQLEAKKNLSLFSISASAPYDWAICATQKSTGLSSVDTYSFGLETLSAWPSISVNLDTEDSVGNVVISVPGVSKACSFTGAVYHRLLDNDFFTITPSAMAEKLESFSVWRENFYGSAATRVLSSEELSILKPEQIAAISIDDVEKIPPADFAKLTVTQLKSFPVSRVRAITGPQLAALSFEQFSAFSNILTGSQLLAKTKLMSNAELASFNRFGELSLGQVGAFSPEQISQLTPSQLSSIGSNLSTLLPVQIKALTDAQFNQIKHMNILLDTQVQFYLKNKLTPEKMAQITEEKLAQMTEQEIRCLSKELIQAIPANLIPKLSDKLIFSSNSGISSDMQRLTVDQIKQLPITSLIHLSRWCFSQEQTSALSTQQVQAIRPSALPAGFWRSSCFYTLLKGKLSKAQIESHDLLWKYNPQPSSPHETVSGAYYNKTSYEMGITAADATNLSDAAIAQLNEWEIQNLPSSALNFLLPKLSQAQTRLIHIDQWQEIVPETIRQLTDLPLIRWYLFQLFPTAEKATAIRPSLLAKLPIEKLNGYDAHFFCSPELTIEHLKAITPTQLKDWRGIWMIEKPEHWAAFSVAQVQALNLDLNLLNHFGTHKVMFIKDRLSTEQIKKLNDMGLGQALQPFSQNIKEITASQVRFLTPGKLAEVFSELSEEQLGGVSWQQLGEMSSDQINTIKLMDLEKLPPDKFYVFPLKTFIELDHEHQLAISMNSSINARYGGTFFWTRHYNLWY